MVRALLLLGAPRPVAWLISVGGPVFVIGALWAAVPAALLGTGVALIGALAVVFAAWLYHQPVPVQAAWESGLVCGAMTLAGGLLVAGGLGLTFAEVQL